MRNQSDASARPPTFTEANGWPILGMLPRLAANLIDALRLLRRRHGDRVHFRIANQHAYLVSDPEGIREVLTAGEDQYSKGPLTEAMRSVFGNSLALSAGDDWRRKRKLLQPLFLNASVRRWQPVVNRHLAQLIESWETAAKAGSIVNAEQDCARLIQKIMAEVLFGDSFPDSLTKDALTATDAVNKSLIGEFFRRFALIGPLRILKTPDRHCFHQAVKRLHAVLDEAMAIGETGKGEHLLAEFRRARSSSGEVMTKNDVREEAVTFFFAGIETTANALSWTLYFLSRHPGVAHKVAIESASVLEDRFPSFEDLRKLVYIRQVLDEAMRMRPPAYAMERRVNGGSTSLSGCPMREGALVVIAPAVTHMHHDHWSNPEEFDPDRFSESASHQRHAFAFIPFGGGARKCIGMQFALMELISAIAVLTRRFEFDFADSSDVKEKIGLTLKPHPRIPLRLKLRRPTTPAEGLRR